MQKLLLLSILFFTLISKLVLSAEVYPFICPENSFQVLEDFINMGAGSSDSRENKNNIGAAETAMRENENNIGALSNNQFSQEPSAQKLHNISERTEEKLQQAQGEHKLYLATYTFTSYPLAYNLAELKKTGADVKILIDNYPVGGISDKKILCFLEENNISVFLYQEPYKYMHAKYIIKDNSELLVVTENFGESGFPSNITAVQTATQEKNITAVQTATQEKNITAAQTATQEKNITAAQTATQEKNITAAQISAQKNKISELTNEKQQKEPSSQKESAQKGNRGWGAVIEDPETSLKFLEIFKKDVSTSKLFKCDLKDYNISSPTNFKVAAKIQKSQKFHDISELSKQKLQKTQSSQKFHDISELPNQELQKTQGEHIFKIYSNQNIETFFAPDNALESILELINSTMNFIYVEQFYIYKYWGSKKQQKPNQFLEALISKARHGAEVKILMDGSYYNILETSPNSNYNTMLYINEIAENESLNLQAKLIDLKALNLQKLHAKVLVSDNSTMVSSVNWNENSPLNNRESGVIITGDSSLFYKQAFLRDWNTGELTEFSPFKLFISSPNMDIYIFICIVSSAGFLAWIKKRKN